MSEIPFFLQSNETLAQQPVLFNIPIYATPQVVNVSGPTATASVLEQVWDKAANSSKEFVGDVKDYVFDTAKNAWVNVTEIGSSAFSGVTSGIQGVVSEIRYNLLFLAVGALIIIWVVAKSGILKQVAGVMK